MSAEPSAAAPARPTWPARDLLARGRRMLERAGVASFEAPILLAWAAGVRDVWHVPARVGARTRERFRSALAQRSHRMPLQHVIGRMWFRGLVLEAGPGVFCVRPETEAVAGEALAAARACASARPRVADLCAGSAAIALSVATEASASRVWAVELSPVAAAYARRNIARIAPGNVRLVVGDATRALAGLEGTFDVVVSNPPYVPAATPPTQPEALRDPPMALFGGGEDGMVIPRGIITRARALLAPTGTLVMEHAERQGPATRRIAREAGFVEVRTKPDLAGRPRMLVARAPSAAKR